jgi:pimeloyl-ACP methyl ester carboxylesterase
MIKHRVLSNRFVLRYRVVGKGPPLVLLHTMRTQIEYFQKVETALAQGHTLYIVDLPGHGRSSILPVEYDEMLFRDSITEFLDRLELRGVTLVGESIGATLALSVAAESRKRVSRVVAINPYDYGETFGGGIRRGSGGWVVGIFEWLRRYTIEPAPLLAAVLAGGLVDPGKLPPSLFEELRRSGKRSGYRAMEASLFRNWRTWIAARRHYGAVRAPVTLVYSEHDWSRPEERERNRAVLRPERMITVPGAGHFLSLEKPEVVIDAVIGTASVPLLEQPSPGAFRELAARATV